VYSYVPCTNLDKFSRTTKNPAEMRRLQTDHPEMSEGRESAGGGAAEKYDTRNMWRKIRTM